jgi:ABC-2 type transport system permease protein
MCHLNNMKSGKVELMEQFTSLLGTFRYEFTMQLRRPSLWIVFVLVSLFIVRSLQNQMVNSVYDTQTAIGGWVMLVTRYYPIVVGLLIADRFPRDRTTHVHELFVTTPSSVTARLWGKYLGATSATFAPIAIVYIVGALLIMQARSDFTALPLALVTFIILMGTAAFFVSAFAIACTTLMWPVIFQFLFVGYWFWGNILNPSSGIPTLNGTLLSPQGNYILAGFFPGTISKIEDWYITATATQAIESLALLVGCAVAALIIAERWIQWQQQHQ